MNTRAWRLIRRLSGFVWIVAKAGWDFAFRLWLCGKAAQISGRARWLQRWSTQILRCLNVRVTRSGQPPAEGVLVSNHLGYLDILVLAAAQPLVFVAKSEVRGWPLVGWLTRCAGTLFIKREQKSDVARMGAAFSPVVNEGVVLGLFPEGTSTGGQGVLPFHSAVFEPAAAAGWRVTPAWIGYTLTDGSVEDDVCYWRDMTFLPHFLRLLTRENIEANVIYGSSLPAGLNRKEMAREAHKQVRQMAERARKPGTPARLNCRFFPGMELLEIPVTPARTNHSWMK